MTTSHGQDKAGDSISVISHRGAREAGVECRRAPRVAALLAAGTLVCALAAVPASRGAEKIGQDDIAALREEIRTNRTAVVAEAMQISDEEGKAFWPLYREYRSATDVVIDGLIKLIRDYAAAYPNIPEDRARQMLQDWTALEAKYVETRATYLKKFGAILSATRTLQLAQVENRLDLTVRLQMMSAIPLMPTPAK